MTDVLPTGKTILSLCDYTGNWPLPYREAGYNVIQVDLKFGQDVRLLEIGKLPPIHGILAAPPCTHFSIAGVRHWKKKGEAPLLEGLALVDACLRAVAILNPVWWVLENPVGRLKYYLGDPVMTFQPWEFGDPWTKRTCLWGRFNTNLIKTPVEPQYAMCVRGLKGTRRVGITSTGKSEGSGADRIAYRSATPLGFARAFMAANP